MSTILYEYWIWGTEVIDFSGLENAALPLNLATGHIDGAWFYPVRSPWLPGLLHYTYFTFHQFNVIFIFIASDSAIVMKNRRGTSMLEPNEWFLPMDYLTTVWISMKSIDAILFYHGPGLHYARAMCIFVQSACLCHCNNCLTCLDLLEVGGGLFTISASVWVELLGPKQ